MTVIISPQGVINTENTEITMGKATINVGGDFTNEGKTNIHDTNLNISGNLNQRGDLRVNDPQKFSEAVLELAKGTRDCASFGKKVLDLLTGNNS